MSPRRTAKPRKAAKRAPGKYLNALRNASRNLRVEPVDAALLRGHEKLMLTPSSWMWADPSETTPNGRTA